jgi:hypothetical protein
MCTPFVEDGCRGIRFEGRIAAAREIQQDNVFNNWQDLVDAMKTVEGRKILEFDDSLVSPNPCEIPRCRRAGRPGR